MSKPSFKLLDIKEAYYLIKKCIKFLRNKNKENNINKTILDFFDLNKPCPQNINECNKLRDQYIESLNIFKKSKICTGCQLATVRQKYISLVKLSLINK